MLKKVVPNKFYLCYCTYEDAHTGKHFSTDLDVIYDKSRIKHELRMIKHTFKQILTESYGYDYNKIKDSDIDAHIKYTFKVMVIDKCDRKIEYGNLFYNYNSKLLCKQMVGSGPSVSEYVYVTFMSIYDVSKDKSVYGDMHVDFSADTQANYIQILKDHAEDYLYEEYGIFCKENINAVLEEHKIICQLSVKTFKKTKRHMTFDNIKNYINHTLTRYPPEECYERVLSALDFIEEKFNCEGELIDSEIYIHGNYYSVRKSDFEPNVEYRFKKGDLVRLVNDELNAEYIVIGAPESIYKDPNQNLVQWTNEYHLEGIVYDKNDWFIYESCVKERYIEKVDKELEVGSFLYIMREMALGHRPMATPEEFDLLEIDGADYKQLKSFQ